MADQTFIDKTTVVPTPWLQDVNNQTYRAAANTLKGNNTGAQGTALDLTVAQAKALLAYVLASADFANQGTATTVLHGNAAGNPSFGPVALGTDVSGTLAAAQFPALTGDVTTTAGSLATTIAALAVTYAKLAAAVTASTAQTQAGSVTNAFVTPGGLKAAQGFSNYFESAEQTLPSAGTQVTVAHGLAQVPREYRAVIRNKTAELNYAIGDEVPYDNTFDGTNQVTMGVNATNIFWVENGVVAINNKTTGARTGITNANWKLVLKAWG